MFNLYQHMNRHAEGKEQKEPETTGHDRFYQERSRSSFRKKKKKGCRRAQSAAELNPASIAAANRRAKFGIRSVSTDREESEEESGEKGPLVAQKIDSIAKLLFNKSIIGSPSGSMKSLPLGDLGAAPRVYENTVENAAATSICTQYLATSSRYELITHLNDIGSRTNRHWFAVRDNSIKTERLLTLVPLGNKCPIEPSDRSRSLILELFRALHHPYIYPVLDVAFCSDFVLGIIPFNARGSIKDLIYNSCWNDDWSKKYGERGNGLPLWQVGRLGRQILEGLLFLKERGFPPFMHLHTGNVMVQNGVARISGLEMTLVGASPRSPFIQFVPVQHVEIVSLGHVLFEMCSGYELDVPKPQPGHLQLDLDRYPQIFKTDNTVSINLSMNKKSTQEVERAIKQLKNGKVGRLAALHIVSWKMWSRREMMEFRIGTEVRMRYSVIAACPPWWEDGVMVVEILETIFNERTPTLHELLMCELFRKIDLREMKGSCLPNFNQRLSSSCINLLSEVARRQGVNIGFRSGLRSEGSSPLATPPLVRRRHYTSEDFSEDWQLYE